MADKEKPECFVLMPISDPEGYEPGHFQRVYEDLLAPACDRAGFSPTLANAIHETNLIHADVLKRLLDAPMALCDLSSRNPNVMFELGLRQAFDKPVCIVRETGTPDIFDIAPLRYVEYRPALIYREVVNDQELIEKALQATSEGQGVNSLVRLLEIGTGPAKLSESKLMDTDPALRVILTELRDLRKQFQTFRSSVPQLQGDATDIGTPRPRLRNIEAMMGLKHPRIEGVEQTLQSVAALQEAVEELATKAKEAPLVALPALVREAEALESSLEEQAAAVPKNLFKRLTFVLDATKKRLAEQMAHHHLTDRGKR